MRERQRRAAARHGVEADEIARCLRKLQAGTGHGLAQLWDDWVSSMALAIANSCDHRPDVHARREAEYMRLVERHGKPTMDAFASMLALLVEALEHLPTDVLGGVYMALELGNDHAGQFFTPSSVCEVMVGMTMDPYYMRAQVEHAGWITVQEPAIGGGAMVIPIVGAMLEAGLNPSEHLHVIGADIDASVLRMAYVQLSLLGVPAVLWVGDTLRMQFREDWYTPVHVLLGWGSRLRNRPLLDVLRGLVVAMHDASDEAEPEPAEPPPTVYAEAVLDGEVARQPAQRELFSEW